MGEPALRRGATEYKGAAWYTREITVPDEWDGLTPWLHFGAVDWSARVWINGRFAAEHDNGYLPFAIDLSDFVQPGETATVTVRAFDVADAATLVGKQVPWWYTHSSGIWQTVWLEGRAPSHITNVRVEPDVAGEQAEVTLRLFVDEAGSHTLRLRSTDEPALRATRVAARPVGGRADGDRDPERPRPAAVVAGDAASV